MAYGQFNLCGECCGVAPVVCEPQQYGGGGYTLDYIRFGHSDPIISSSYTASLQVNIGGDQTWAIYAQKTVSPNLYYVTQTYPSTGRASKTIRLVDPAAIPTWQWTISTVTGDQAEFESVFGMTCQEFIDSLSLTVNPLAGDLPNTTRVSGLSAPLVYAPFGTVDPEYGDTLLRGVYPPTYSLSGAYFLGLRTWRSAIGNPSCSTLLVTIPETSPFAGQYWLGAVFNAGDWEFRCQWHRHVNYLPSSQLQVVCSGLANAFTPSAAEIGPWAAWLSELSGSEIMCSCVRWAHDTDLANTTSQTVKFLWELHGRYQSTEAWARLELTYNWLTSTATAMTATVDVAHAGYTYILNWSSVPAATRFTMATPGGWTMPVQTAQQEYTLTNPNTGQSENVIRNVLSDVDAFKDAASALTLLTSTPESRGFTASSVSCS